VPLVLAGFGIGALAGSVLGGRFGDRRPYATTIAAPALTAIILLAICLLSAHAMPTVALVSLLGLFGLGANPVLISLAVRFASQAPILGSALCVSAFNVGTAFGTWLASLALGSTLGTRGPAVVGAFIAALTVLPAVVLARRAGRSAVSFAENAGGGDFPCPRGQLASCVS
jgi:DHA1 family inner membrane transport protein